MGRLAICVSAKLGNILLKPRIGQRLRVVFAFHAIVYDFYQCLRLLLFQKGKQLIFFDHPPDFGHVNFFFCFKLLFFSSKSGILKKQEAPYFTVLIHGIFEVIFISLFFFFLEIDEPDNWDSWDDFFLFHGVEFVQIFVVKISFPTRTKFYQAFLVHEVFDLLEFGLGLNCLLLLLKFDSF